MAEFIDNSEKVRKTIQQQLAGGLNRGNEFMMESAKSDAPVQSGELRDGIGVVTEASEASLLAVGAARAPYSRFINRHHTPFWDSAWIRMKVKWGEFFRG